MSKSVLILNTMVESVLKNAGINLEHFVPDPQKRRYVTLQHNSLLKYQFNFDSSDYDPTDPEMDAFDDILLAVRDAAADRKLKGKGFYLELAAMENAHVKNDKPKAFVFKVKLTGVPVLSKDDRFKMEKMGSVFELDTTGETKIKTPSKKPVMSEPGKAHVRIKK
jgi:hypothetical protein